MRAREVEGENTMRRERKIVRKKQRKGKKERKKIKVKSERR